MGPISDRVGRGDQGAAPAVGAAAVLVAFVLFVAACGGSPASVGGPARTGANWDLSALGVPENPASSFGRGQLIAVLDTGLSPAGLPSLAARLVEPWNQIAGRQGAVDDNGHGTEVAVVAAGGGDAGVWGLAPGATVMPIKVADADGQADPRVVAAAITRAVKLRASVINLSLATEVPDAALGSAISDAVNAGVVVVAAAGDVSETGPQFPASEPRVIAVYAQDRTGAVVAQFNQPVGPAAIAPGIDVDAVVGGPSGISHVRVSGTSVAAAIVSGLVADCLGAQRAAGLALRRAISICESRMVRSPSAPGFLNLKSIMEV